MSTEAIFSALTGAGGTAIILALISWARGKNQDKGDVAKNWESGVSTLLQSAEQQVKRVNAELTRIQEKLTQTEADLDACQAKCRQITLVVDDALRDLERRGGDTTAYRDRLTAV